MAKKQSGGQRLRPVWRLGLCAAAAQASCGLFSEPSLSAVYHLKSINGDLLPAFMISFTATDGNRTWQEGIEAMSGTFWVRSNRSFIQETEARRVRDGVIVDSVLPGRIAGRYELDGTRIVFHFTHPDGYAEKLEYTLADDERILRGVQDSRVYEWERR